MSQLLLIILFLGSLTNCFAAKEPYTLTIRVVDEYSGAAIPNAQVTITRGRRTIASGISNDSGIVLFPDFKSKRMRIFVNTKDGMYSLPEVKHRIYSPYNYMKKIVLYPSLSNEALIFAREDSIYGTTADAEISRENKYNWRDQDLHIDHWTRTLSNFIRTHCHYPRYMNDQDIEGEVKLYFVIETDGSISHITI